eukprot:TRINITY_DN2075_c0_g1_i5.p1 TRINITY_DN2075_c0_g1~~TRINITY_DN2075_c0_g1_i5.p1  ORF type:complete len:104 (-),score=33.49 TRINITY_DN2075_c0_g1_i5:401-712(-)
MSKSKKKRMKKKAAAAKAAAAEGEHVVTEDEESTATESNTESEAVAVAPIVLPEVRSMDLLAVTEGNVGAKLADFGSGCWTYKQFTDDVQTRQYRCGRWTYSL